MRIEFVTLQPMLQNSLMQSSGLHTHLRSGRNLSSSADPQALRAAVTEGHQPAMTLLTPSRDCLLQDCILHGHLHYSVFQSKACPALYGRYNAGLQRHTHHAPMPLDVQVCSSMAQVLCCNFCAIMHHLNDSDRRQAGCSHVMLLCSSSPLCASSDSP